MDGAIQYVPVLMIVQFIGMGVWAGMNHQRITSLSERQKEDRDKHDAELAKLRAGFDQALSDVRKESQTGREAGRLETQTLIQSTGATVAERMAALLRDFQRLEEGSTDEFRNARNEAGTVQQLLTLHEARLRDLEREARGRGAKGISDHTMPAVNPARGGYPEVYHVGTPEAARAALQASRTGRNDPRRERP